MIDNLIGGDDDSDDSTADGDMDGGLFDGAEGGDDDDLMGDDDDLMGGGDDLMGGDEDMAFDDMDNGGSATSAEMDNRIDELENEVASLSSTVNTVKSENEQISESVEEVEENIRKLLEVYEMVTRGVNPFVDENEMGDAFGGGAGGAGDGDGSMGLFGGDEQAGENDIDESVADADADDFFDEDLDDGSDEDDDFADFDDDFEEGNDGDGFDDFEEGDGVDDADDGDGEGGKSFEELKAEYESGDADWDDGDGGGTAEDDEAIDGEISSGIGEEESDPTDELEGDVGTDGIQDDTGTETAIDAGDGTTSDAGGGAPVSGGKPYLETLPSGYVSDIVVMDWLEFLVEEAGVDGAARTIAYYKAIGWLDEPAADTLQTFLNGFGGTVEDDPEPRSELTVSHHNTSLRFINRIVNPDMEMVSFGDGRSQPGHAMGERGNASVNGRARTDPSGDGSVSRPPREHRGVESDGGRELSAPAREHPTDGTVERSNAFDWIGDRRE